MPNSTHVGAPAFGGNSTTGDDSFYDVASVDSSPDLCPTAATVPPTPADGLAPNQSRAGLTDTNRLPAFRVVVANDTSPPSTTPAGKHASQPSRSVSVRRPRLVTEPDRMRTAELQQYAANIRKGMALLKPGDATHTRLAARLERFEAELVRRRFPGWATPSISIDPPDTDAGLSQADDEDGDPLMPSACLSRTDSWQAQRR